MDENSKEVKTRRGRHSCSSPLRHLEKYSNNKEVSCGLFSLFYGHLTKVLQGLSQEDWEIFIIHHDTSALANSR